MNSQSQRTALKVRSIIKDKSNYFFREEILGNDETKSQTFGKSHA